MIWIPKRPPENFEDFVAEYFHMQTNKILRNYKAKMNEGNYMKQLFLRLIVAFEKKGIQCGDLIDEAIFEEMKIKYQSFPTSSCT